MADFSQGIKFQHLASAIIEHCHDYDHMKEFNLPNFKLIAAFRQGNFPLRHLINYSTKYVDDLTEIFLQ